MPSEIQHGYNKLLHADSVSCRGFCKKTQKRAPTYSAGEQGVIPKKMKITPLKEHPIQGTVTDITKQYVLRCDREKPSNNPPETEKEIGAVLDN